jgi:hypothetical protein
MTMYRTVLVAILLVTAPKSIDADAITGHAFGKTYTIVVGEEDLKKGPAWDQAAENPPLSARRALKLATDSRKATIPGHAEFEWQLRYLGLRESEGRWYWLADFHAFPRHGSWTGIPPELYVAVLMDGTVVKPEIRDRQH